jgi:hypothetical protein
VDLNETLVALQEHVRNVALSAYAHQDVPFEAVTQTLQEHGFPAARFRIMVIDQNIGLDETEPAGLRTTDFELVPDGDAREPALIASTFDLIVEIEKKQSAHRVTARYAIDALRPEFVRSLLRSVETMVDCLTTHAELSLVDVQLPG